MPGIHPTALNRTAIRGATLLWFGFADSSAKVIRKLAFIFLMLIAGMAMANTKAGEEHQSIDIEQLSDEPLSLTPYFAIFEDKSGMLTLDQIKAQSFNDKLKGGNADAWSLDFGVTRSAYWLRLHVRNSTENPFQGMLEFTYPRLATDVQMFEVTENSHQLVSRTGYSHPFSERLYKHHFYVFPIGLKPHSEKIIYFRFVSDVKLEIPARLWKREAFHSYERIDYASNAIYFGMVLALMSFNFLIFLTLRARTYLLYSCFGFLSALSIAATNGLAIEYLWGNFPYWINVSSSVGYSASLAVGIVFMRSMIATRKLVPQLDLALKATALLNVLLAIGICLSYLSFIRIQLFFAGISALFVLWTGIVCVFKKDRSAIFFIAAFSVMTLGAAANSLRALGVISTSFFSTNGIQVGSSIEMLLLAFALADRYNSIRLEKEQAQRAALVAQQNLVESLQSSERLLETRVSQRTEELRMLNSKLLALSATDGLTGLANRRCFDEELATEWRRALRLGQPLAIGILDVDWFKKYNDRYGHISGDECLRKVAEILAKNVCRAGDLVSRYGGEEFAFIAAGADNEKALGIAHKICQSIVECAIPHESSDFGIVTVSIGVAAVAPKNDSTPHELLKAADDALYMAKESGRNQVCLARRYLSL